MASDLRLGDAIADELVAHEQIDTRETAEFMTQAILALPEMVALLATAARVDEMLRREASCAAEMGVIGQTLELNTVRAERDRALKVVEAARLMVDGADPEPSERRPTGWRTLMRYLDEYDAAVSDRG